MPKRKSLSSGKDLLMILLYARGKNERWGEAISGRTRLVKMVFLFKEELSINDLMKNKFSKADLPNFVAYKYGPFSSEVYSDLDFLINLQLVRAQISETEETIPEEALEYSLWQEEVAIGQQGYEDEYIPELFQLTASGKEFCEKEYKDALTSEQWNLISEFKKRSTEVPLSSLLSYVYLKYPPFTVNSEIKHKVMQNQQ